MNREEFITTLRRCLRKAFLDTVWTFSTDEDEDAKLCLDGQDRLVFCFVKSPYTLEHIAHVKYGIDEGAEDYYVILELREGGRLRIGEERGEAYILLQTGRIGDIQLYRSGGRP